MPVIRLLLADDYSMVREGVRGLLENIKELHVISETGDCEECLKILSEERPDILILDVFMQNRRGFDLLKKINKKKKRDVKILLLMGTEKKVYLQRAAEIGIDGYVWKKDGFEVLLNEIFSVMSGECRVWERKELIEIKKKMDRIGNLTKRELDVLQNLAAGMYNKEIAIKLKISERTVKNHIFSIFKKIGVSDRTQAAVFAIRNELV